MANISVHEFDKYVRIVYEQITRVFKNQWMSSICDDFSKKTLHSLYLLI